MPGTLALSGGFGAAAESVSCATAGYCAAGGVYVDGSFNEQAFVVDETNGSWGAAIEIPGTATLNSGGYAGVFAVSCATAGNCAAGGFYVDGSGNQQSFVVDETDGTWGTAIEVPGTATLNSGGGFGNAVDSISCPTVGNCAAGGGYLDGSGHNQAFVVDETNGSWGAAIEVPGTATLNQGFSNNGVDSVSCATAGNCSAVGDYRDGADHIQSFVADETNGSWGTAIEIPGTETFNGGGDTEVNSVSCATAGNCAAAGQYTDGPSRIHAFVVNAFTKAFQAIQITTSAPASAVYGTSFTVAATGGNSGNPVTYGSAGGCTNSGAHFAMTSGTAVCTVTYDQAGDDNYNAAPEVTESVTAMKLDQSITFATPANRPYGGANFNPGATSSSGNAVSYGASGACSIVGGKVHLTGAGSCSVTASQAGDADYNAAPPVQRMFSVGKAALSITANNRQKFYAQSLTLGTTAFTLSGLVGSDSVSGVTLMSSGAAAAAASGSYSIVPSHAVAGPNTNLGNYTITFHNGMLHVLAVGIIGLNGVSVTTNGGKIDSFNSSAGPYGSSNHGSAALVMSNGPLSFGGVALLGSAESTQGSVSVAKSASVSGNVIAGTTASILGTVGGTVTQHSPTTPLSGPTVSACSPHSAKTGISGGTFSYSAGTGNLAVKSGTVKLASRTYCFNNVTLAAGSVLSVSGSVTIHLIGKLTGSGQIVNTTNLPRNLHIDTSFAGSSGLAIAGGSHAYMTILAPRTTVTISGGSIFGTLLAGTVTLTGATAFHADIH